MDRQNNYKLIQIYNQAIDSPEEWANRILILKIVYDVLVNYPNGGWEVHVAGSITYGGIERGSDIDFALSLKEKDDTVFAAIQRFSRQSFCDMVTERDPHREVHLHRVRVTKQNLLIRCEFSVSNDILRIIQVDISLGSDTYRVGHYLSSFALDARFCLLTCIFKRIMSANAVFKSNIECINGISLAVLVLGYLSSIDHEIKNKCLALRSTFPAEPMPLTLQRPDFSQMLHKDENFIKHVINFSYFVKEWPFNNKVFSISSEDPRMRNDGDSDVPMIVDNSAFASQLNAADRLTTANFARMMRFFHRTAEAMKDQRRQARLLADWNESTKKAI